MTLDDGRELTGDLLVGADGRRSSTAARAGIKRTGWDYGQTALVCAISHEKPHDGIAHQFFMPPGPAGHFAAARQPQFDRLERNTCPRPRDQCNEHRRLPESTASPLW